MNIQTISLIISEPLRVATPLILAALGELVTEKLGVLNLSVVGMMLVGPVASFVAASITGNIYLKLFIALISGIAIALMSQSTANASIYNAIVSTNNAIVSTDNANVVIYNSIRFSQVLTLCQSKFFNLDAERLAAGYR
ncbi:hypothetical protein [Nostoc sp.]|uniref:hypothetical protein n=1 Tax=Nostoc sp. TaxID=1180 RepID=UPI002FF5CAEB